MLPAAAARAVMPSSGATAVQGMFGAVCRQTLDASMSSVAGVLAAVGPTTAIDVPDPASGRTPSFFSSTAPRSASSRANASLCGVETSASGAAMRGTSKRPDAMCARTMR